MYSYRPPKSNIWGHSLRKIEPTRQKALFDEFLEKAVAEYSATGGSLTLFVGLAPTYIASDLQEMREDPKRAQVEHFEKLLGIPSHNNGSFYSLTGQQCETALAELIQESGLMRGSMLLQGFEISKWRIEGRPVELQSRIHLYYGVKPCISTFLRFETMEQFEFIKGVLSDLNFCKLNEKHLKPIKHGLKKKSGEHDE